MLVFLAFAMLGAAQAQIGGNMMNLGWGNNGLGGALGTRMGTGMGTMGTGGMGTMGAGGMGTMGVGGMGTMGAGGMGAGGMGALGARGMGAGMGAMGAGGLNARQVPQFITCIGKNTAGDQMRVTIQDGTQQSQQNYWNRWMRPQQNKIIKLEARIMISPSSQTTGQFQMVITQNSRVEDGCLGQFLGRIIDNRPWWVATANQETGIIGRPFYLSPGHVASTSEIMEGFNTIYEVNGHGIALCPATSIRNGMCVDDPGAMIPMCCKAGLDRMPATTPIPQSQFGQQQGFGNMNTMGSMMPTAGTGLQGNTAALTGGTGGTDLNNLFGAGR